MFFHAKINLLEGGNHYWWNYSEFELVDELISPYVNGQIIPVNLNGHIVLLNMKTVKFLKVYKTPEKLVSANPLEIPSEIEKSEFELFECTEDLLDKIRIAHFSRTKKSFLELSFTKPQKQIFVIMKFGDRLMDSAYQGVIKPLIKEFGYRPIRIDEVEDSGKISDQIFETIASSKYVLADLSGERPNCYYETGFAHALGKEIILCIRKEEKIHFDLSHNRFIVWETEADLRQSLKKRLKMLLEPEKKTN